MNYMPRRDYRFDYVWEAMRFVEDNQCVLCVHRKAANDGGVGHGSEFPMCWEVEAEFIAEQMTPSVEDEGTKGIRCTKFEDEEYE